MLRQVCVSKILCLVCVLCVPELYANVLYGWNKFFFAKGRRDFVKVKKLWHAISFSSFVCYIYFFFFQGSQGLKIFDQYKKLFHIKREASFYNNVFGFWLLSLLFGLFITGRGKSWSKWKRDDECFRIQHTFHSENHF